MTKIFSYGFLVAAIMVLSGCQNPDASMQKSQAKRFSLEKCTQECSSFGMEVAISESKANGNCRCKSISDGVV